MKRDMVLKFENIVWNQRLIENQSDIKGFGWRCQKIGSLRI